MSIQRVIPRRIEEYRTPAGVSPLGEWLRRLKDANTRALINRRLYRVELGNLGEWAPVGEGVCELKIHLGPGYRIYYGEDGDTIVVLLCGGDKRTQREDIKKAKAYWRDYRSAAHAEADKTV